MNCKTQWLKLAEEKETIKFNKAKETVKALINRQGIEKDIALALFEAPMSAINSLFGNIENNYNWNIYEDDILEKISFISFFIGHELLDDGCPGFAYETSSTLIRIFDEKPINLFKAIKLKTICDDTYLSKEPLTSFSKKIIYRSQDIFEYLYKEAHKNEIINKEDYWLESCQCNLQAVLDLINDHNNDYKSYVKRSIKDEERRLGIGNSCWSKETPYDKLEIIFIRDLIKEIENE